MDRNGLNAMNPLLAELLEATYRRYHTERHLQQDPLSLVRRFTAPADIEVAGIIASSFAFGRVDGFMPKIEKLLLRLGSSPAVTLATAREDAPDQLADGMRHRFAGPREIAGLLRRLALMMRETGRVRPAFDVGYRREGRVEDGLKTLSQQLRGDGEPGFLIPSFERGSAMKRMNLFLRWMVRDDGLDLGIWRDVPTSRLLMPLDVHVFRIAQRLGLLKPRSSSPSLADAAALRDALANFDEQDPVRFDFALSHLGISGDCRHGRDTAACASCALKGFCTSPA